MRDETYTQLLNGKKVNVDNFDQLTPEIQEELHKEYEIKFEQGECWLTIPPNQGVDKNGTPIQKGDMVAFEHQGNTIHSYIWQIDSRGRIWVNIPPMIEFTVCKQYKDHPIRPSHRNSAEVVKL